MGANCCVPTRRDKGILVGLGNRVESAHINVRCSPSWNIRWDNRTHIEDIMESPPQFHHYNSENVGSEIKSGADTETESHSDDGSPADASRTSRRKKFPVKSSILGSKKADAGDQFVGSNSFPEEKKCSEPPDIKLSIQLPSTPSPSTYTAEPSSSRKPHRSSPVDQLTRQVSLDSPNGGGSSDGWSMRTFSELVASSQKERWSFDMASSIQTKTRGPAPDTQTCGICSKLVRERSSWASNELSVVAVLICGHVYHAECLENETPAAERFDPSCVLCRGGGSFGSKASGKSEAKTKSKISRRAVADFHVDGEHLGKGSRMGASSSMKNTFRRHFSFGPRTARSASENESTRKKGFWARYR